MKKAFVTICSIFLILACLFGLFACVTGMKDNLNIKDYKTIDGEEAEAGVAAAREGIALLKEASGTYLAGVDTYEAGIITLSEGKSALSDGYAAYYAGKAQLEEGKAAYAAGKAQIEANTQAYNEGKETLAKIEPLMPLVNAYIEFRDNGIGKIMGFSDAQAWFAATVRPLAANLGLAIPDDVVDFPAYIQTMVADGQAQLKVYEDGLAQLAEAEKTIAAGEQALREAEAQLAAGETSLKDGEKQLDEGDTQLKVYEDGEASLAAGMEQLMAGMTASCTRDGVEVVPSLKALLGDDFSIWAKDENGKIKVERGCQFLDLDACTKLCDEADHYLELSGADTTGEIVGRILICALMGLGSVFGIIAGITVLFGKKTGFGAGLVTAICAIGGDIAGLVIGYGNLAYMPKTVVDGTDTFNYVGDLQMVAVIVLAIVAVLFVIAAGMMKKNAAKAAPAEEDKVSELTKENETLKEMVAKLAEESAKN